MEVVCTKSSPCEDHTITAVNMKKENKLLLPFVTCVFVLKLKLYVIIPLRHVIPYAEIR